LAGFLTSGADLLRRTLTGDNERQAMKTHSKNKRSKMALSRSERKVNLQIQCLVYTFYYIYEYTVFSQIPRPLLSLKIMGYQNWESMAYL
jgi:hypothetical protein